MVIKILYYSEGWGLGGIERFIVNTVEELNRNNYSFDVFCTHDWDAGYDEIISSLGGKRYTVFHGFKPNLVKRTICSSNAWRKQLRSKHYDAVHINTMNGMGFLYAKIAYDEGIPVRIVHSHNSTFGSGSRMIKHVMHRFGQKAWARYATFNLACSPEAGEYLFGDRKFEVIRNGVDTERFRFNMSIRSQLRVELGVGSGSLLFGSVGRLAEAKNPLFQIRVLKVLCDMGVDAHLLLVGEGPLSQRVREEAETLGLTDRVHLPGGTAEPERFMSALDVFTMPSLYEGFPMTVVEATDNGLPLLISNAIHLGSFETPGIQYLPADQPRQWAEAIMRCKSDETLSDRIDGPHIVNSLGYNCVAITRQLESMYSSANC